MAATEAKAAAFAGSLADSTTQVALQSALGQGQGQGAGVYKKSSERIVTLRNIPSQHFTQTLQGQHEPIAFLQRLSVGYNPKLNDQYQIIIKTTSVRCPFNDKFDNVKQMTSFFDISSRPIGSVLREPMEIKLKCSEEEIKSLQGSNLKVVLNCFDYNTRTWYQKATDASKLVEGCISVKVQFFGKFCFTTQPNLQEFLLSEVATCHKISNTKSTCCELSIKNDVISRNGALVSIYNEKISQENLERARNAISCPTVNLEEIHNIRFNRACVDEAQKAKIACIRKDVQEKNENEESDEKSVTLALVQRDHLTWTVVNADHVFISSGHDYKIAFVETDVGSAQDEKKLQFFAAELEFVQNSSKASLYIYTHKSESNRVHIGFHPKKDAEENWNLVSSTSDLIIEELSKVYFRVTEAEILLEDNSPKTLIYFNNNKTGIDFYLYRNEGEGDQNAAIKLDLGINDSVTKEMGIVLSCEIPVDENSAQKLSPYTTPKVYGHVEPPEIYREYKLQWLKFLSPAEREKYKEINGM